MAIDDVRDGVYFIVNKASRTLIDLPVRLSMLTPVRRRALVTKYIYIQARDNPGKKVVGWAFGLVYPHLFDHQHWLIQQDGQNRAYTIQNIGNGNMLELAQG